MLTSEQEKAAAHLYGPALVSAGPGSGKTRVLTERIARLCMEVPAADICVFTFTQAAAREMKQRFEAEAGDEKAAQIAFGTFHSIFLRWLRRWGVISKNTIVDAESDDSRDSEIPAFSMGQRDRDSMNVIGFDEIIERTREAVLLRGFRMSYRFYLIDEFQDIDSVQYDIVKALVFPENNLFAVGDEDQSIYGFRGTNPSVMMDFIRDFPDVTHLYLSENFRCSQAISSLSQCLIRQNRDRFDKDMISHVPSPSPVKISHYRDTMEELRKTAEQIRSLHLAKRIPYHQMAVLLRTRVEGDMMISALKEAAIPADNRILRDSEFQHKDFVLVRRDLERFMTAAAAPDLPDSIRTLSICFPLLKDRDRKDLSAEERIEIESGIRVIERFKKLPLSLVAMDLLWNSTYGDYLKNKCEKNGIPGWYILLQLMFLFRKEGKGVRITTMHGAKGLEFEAVWIPGLNENSMPRYEAVSASEIEEERRLLYVAMTRARKYLFMSFNDEREISRFLKEMGYREQPRLHGQSG